MTISCNSQAQECEVAGISIVNRDNIKIDIRSVEVLSGNALYDNGRMTKPIQINYVAQYEYTVEYGDTEKCETSLTPEEFDSRIHLGKYDEYATDDDIKDLTQFSTGFVYSSDSEREGTEYAHNLDINGPMDLRDVSRTRSEPRQNLNTLWVSYDRFAEDQWIGYPDISLCAYSTTKDGQREDMNHCNDTTSDQDPTKRDMRVLDGRYQPGDIGSERVSDGELCGSKSECQNYTTYRESVYGGDICRVKNQKGRTRAFSNTIRKIDLYHYNIQPKIKANFFSADNVQYISTDCMTGTQQKCTDKNYKPDVVNYYALDSKHQQGKTDFTILKTSHWWVGGIHGPQTHCSMEQRLTTEAPFNRTSLPSGYGVKETVLWPDNENYSIDSKQNTLSKQTVVDDYGNKIIIQFSADVTLEQFEKGQGLDISLFNGDVR
ncbi:hypothetical protein [Vibrio sagamiensis]|nr:hypothetical protein [Vibrio sagamiensis]